MPRTKLNREIIGFAAIAILLIGGCGGSKDDTLIRVNDRRMTAADFEERIISRAPAGGLDAMTAWVDGEIDRVAVSLWLASEYPVDLGDRVERARRRHCAELEVKRWMGVQTGLEEKARAWFEGHRSDYDAPERFVLQILFLPADEPGTAALADRLSKELAADPDRFDELARKHSRSETARQGGRSDVIDAKRLHPVILKASRDHAEDRSVFRVDLDRGTYLIRVLGHVPVVPATWEAARQRAFDDASREMLDEFERQAVVEFEDDHSVRRTVDRLGLLPVVAPSEVVLEIDDTELTLSDLLPVDQLHRAVPGPVAEEMVLDHLRTVAFVARFQCDQVASDGNEEMALAAGVPVAVRRFAREEMDAEVAAFVHRQKDVMRHPPVYRLTLVVLPVGVEDPYEVSQDVRRTLSDVMATGNAPATEALVLADLEADESQLRAFDPRLAAMVSGTPPGRVTQTIINPRVGAALGAVVWHREPPRPLDLGRPEDFDLALDWFLSSERETVMAAATRTARQKAVVDHGAVEDLVARLADREPETDAAP